MAHTCPTCGQWCYCGGDCEDCGNDFPDDVDNCIHCPALCEPDCECHDDPGADLSDLDFPGLRALANGYGMAEARSINRAVQTERFGSVTVAKILAGMDVERDFVAMLDQLKHTRTFRFWLLRDLSERRRAQRLMLGLTFHVGTPEPVGRFEEIRRQLGQRGSNDVTWMIVVPKTVADDLVARGMADVADEDD